MRAFWFGVEVSVLSRPRFDGLQRSAGRIRFRALWRFFQEQPVFIGGKVWQLLRHQCLRCEQVYESITLVRDSVHLVCRQDCLLQLA